MPNILDLSARLSADVKPFVNSMGSSAQSSRTTFQNIAQAATMYLGGRGLLGTLNNANEAFKSFEQSLADASAISTLSVKQIGNALMSLDNVFGQVSKASASMYRILSSGFSKLDAEQLVEFQKAVGVSAKVIRADLYNTADVMTTIANAYQLNIDEIKKLQDWFYLTVREGKAQGQDLARTLGLVINSASEAGVSLNELGAAIAVLSRTQSVSQSMIGLNQMLNAFIKPTLQAQAAARKWGIELNATALQTRGLTSFLTELHEKVGGNVEALEAMFGNIRAGRAILSLTGKQFQNYLNVLNTYNTEQGGGAEAFAKQIDTLENAYERFQAQQEKTLIRVGEDWEGVRKIIYRTGESMLKAFSDTSAFSRWSIYFAGIGLAVKNIISVVRNLKNTIDGTTNAVDRLASAFTKASVASHGLTGVYHNARPDTMVLRKELDKALRVTTGNYSPLSARYQTVMKNTVPYAWSGLKNVDGFFKQTPYSFIGQHMLSEKVAEHQVIARSIARRLIKNRLVKYEDIKDANGNVIDWRVLDAVTGKKYAKPMSWFEDQMTKGVFKQSRLAEKAMRGDLGAAIKIISGSKAAQAKVLAAADARVNAFYSNVKGARMSSLYNMSSIDRLQRMQGKGIFSGLSWDARKTVFQQKGFFAGMKNEAAIFSKSIGTGMGKAFSAMAVVGLGASVAELGYKFGSAIAEQFELSGTGYFRRLGGWFANLTNGSMQHMDYKDAEREGLQAQMVATQGRYTQSVERAKKAGMDATKIAEYQLNFMRILSEDDELESAVTRLRDLVNDFITQLDALNSKVETANKFEQERQEILKQYEGKTLDEISTSIQKAAIFSKFTDFGKFDKNDKAVALAREVFTSGGRPEDVADALERLTYKTYGEFGVRGGMVKYDDWEKRQADFIAAYTKMLQQAVLSEILERGVNINDIRKYIGERTDIHTGTLFDTPLWFKEGKFYETEEKGAYRIDAQTLKSVLDIIEQNPTSIEDAEKELLINKIRPYVTNAFNSLLDDVNRMAAFEDEILDIEDLGLELDDNEALRYEKAARSKIRAQYAQKNYQDWWSYAMQQRENVYNKVIKDMSEAHPDMSQDLIRKEAERQRDIYDKTFIPQAAKYQEQVMRAVELAQNNEESAFNVSYKRLQESYNERRLTLEAVYNLGEVSYEEYVDGIIDAYNTFFKDAKALFESGNLTEDMKRKLRSSSISMKPEQLKFEIESMIIGVADTLADSLTSIDMHEVFKHLNKNQATQKRMGAYRKAKEQLANDIVRYVAGDDLGRRYNTETGNMDGPRKNVGWKGLLSDRHGGIMSEVSRGVEIEGTEVEIPLIIPSSTKKDLISISKLVHGELKDEKEIARLEDKAITWAKKRIAEGKSPFYDGAKGDRALRKVNLDWNVQSILNDKNNALFNSPQGKELRKKYLEFLRQQKEEENALEEARGAARSQLMDSVSGVINSNIENGYLTSYGLHHAMNMLARLKSGFAYDLGGADLKDVLNNAHARYSGYTPNTSKAMQAQHKLSEIMDAYITAKQYEDAGIGKNVETIVTLMGKRQPLYLN